MLSTWKVCLPSLGLSFLLVVLLSSFCNITLEFPKQWIRSSSLCSEGDQFYLTFVGYHSVRDTERGAGRVTCDFTTRLQNTFST